MSLASNCSSRAVNSDSSATGACGFVATNFGRGARLYAGGLADAAGCGAAVAVRTARSRTGGAATGGAATGKAATCDLGAASSERMRSDLGGFRSERAPWDGVFFFGEGCGETIAFTELGLTPVGTDVVRGLWLETAALDLRRSALFAAATSYAAGDKATASRSAAKFATCGTLSASDRPDGFTLAIRSRVRFRGAGLEGIVAVCVGADSVLVRGLDAAQNGMTHQEMKSGD